MTKCLVIGSGIAGPVLAMLLKHKGFDPEIYERSPDVPVGGIGLGLSPQTLKVLNILGLAHDVIALGTCTEQTITYSQLRGGEELARSDGPGKLSKLMGWPLVAVPRPKYCEFLCNSARERGIPIHFGKKLVDVRQEGEKVTAVFEDGTEAEGDLLFGCDGLHSGVRSALFGKEDAIYMGLTQIGGISPKPEVFKTSKPAMRQYLGDGVHFLCGTFGGTDIVWATTFRSSDPAAEDWRRIKADDVRDMVRNLEPAKWDNGPKQLIESAKFITKWGLYERPILPVWHKGRAVLLGDAAHPTSPHFGQGANQAMEDCYHIVRLLCRAQPLTNESIEAAFTEYERIRIPIVTLSVGQAKIEGERRVTSGREACEKRDELLKQGDGTDPAAAKLRMELMQGPFVGESEI